jgi:hypothetical protein
MNRKCIEPISMVRAYHTSIIIRCPVTTAEFLVYGARLGMCVFDVHGNLKLMTYDPMRLESKRGFRYVLGVLRALLW